MTIGDLLTAALFDLGVLQEGETMSGDMGAFALARGNDWVDALKTEGLTVYTNTRTTWTLVANTASYTVGTAGTVAMERPVNAQSIRNIGFQDTSVSPTLERMLGPCLTEDQYAAIPQKTYTSVYPEAFYYNPTFASSLGRLWVFPIPTSTTLQGVIYAPAPVGEFSLLSTTILVPPGYRRFYRTNIALELAAAFGADVSPALLKAAQESRADVKRANYRPQDMTTGIAGALFGRGPWYDINAGP